MLGPVYKQVIFWVIYIAYLWSFAIVSDPGADFIVFLHKNVLLFCFFYFNIYISFPILFVKRKPLKFTTVIILTLFVYYLLRYLLTNSVLHLWGKVGYEDEIGLLFFSNQAFMFITYATYALVFWYARKSFLTEQQLRITETEKLKGDKEILQLKNDKLTLEHEQVMLEYNYLKTQINPHFLYNTLACFYDEAEQHSEKLSVGIANLSAIMRYALHDGDTANLVPLEAEIDRLKQYIQLHQMRYKETLKVSFEEIIDNPEGVTIPPFIFITLVENAFKHGQFSKQGHPLVIQVEYRYRQLHFYVRNKISNATKDKLGTGIGLQNVEKRLQHTYNDQYQLSYGADSRDFYTVSLTIQFAHKPVETP
jgi:two-component system, LytTR family, sensor kinase